MKPANHYKDSGDHQESDEVIMNTITSSLEMITRKLDLEMAARQRTVDLQEQEIKRLHLLLEDKNNLILRLNDKIAECKQNAEGSRQLINKLLNDIERLQQDIEWYKRTYEKRSLLGTIKEKLFRNNIKN